MSSRVGPLFSVDFNPPGCPRIWGKGLNSRWMARRAANPSGISFQCVFPDSFLLVFPIEGGIRICRRNRSAVYLRPLFFRFPRKTGISIRPREHPPLFFPAVPRGKRRNRRREKRGKKVGTSDTVSRMNPMNIFGQLKTTELPVSGVGNPWEREECTFPRN